MPSFHASKLLPPGFAADEAASDDDRTVVTIRGVSAISACPFCGAASLRIHSRYDRRLADLPMAGRRVVLMRHARRFRCDAVQCARRIFAERFDDNILKPWVRRTARLDQIVHCLALALGARPAASFARRQAFLDAIRKSMRDIRAAVGATTFNPELLTSAERFNMRGSNVGRRRTPLFWR